MGKGDIKSKRGKIFNKSYGVRRPQKKKKHNTNISNRKCVYCGISLLKRSEAAKFQAKTNIILIMAQHVTMFHNNVYLKDIVIILKRIDLLFHVVTNVISNFPKTNKNYEILLE